MTSPKADMTPSEWYALLASAEADPMNAELYRQAGLAVYYDVTWDDGSPRWKGKDWASDDLAVELLSHAIELDPANPALYRDRGRLCDEEG
ncbi:MAG: hypothetical protein O2826_02760 [Chloroflexi bacterium]|nr:hypothetical protein [Chloroflexota bacterium]MDA1173421.1 hypothetical protein [Chloroflexota bacterium]